MPDFPDLNSIEQLTGILRRLDRADRTDHNRAQQLVYDELRRMAGRLLAGHRRPRPGPT